MTTLAIDAGHAGEGNACALFDVHGRLWRQWFERVTPGVQGYLPRYHVDTVIVERPEYQGARSNTARPGDLMNLAWSGALLAGSYLSHRVAYREYTPSQWKGSEAKPQCHSRLWEVLDDEERALLGGARTEKAIAAALEKGALRRWKISGADCYPRSFTMHNILDAVAMGCVDLGRLKKAGTAPHQKKVVRR